MKPVPGKLYKRMGPLLPPGPLRGYNGFRFIQREEGGPWPIGAMRTASSVIDRVDSKIINLGCKPIMYVGEINLEKEMEKYNWGFPIEEAKDIFRAHMTSSWPMIYEFLTQEGMVVMVFPDAFISNYMVRVGS